MYEKYCCVFSTWTQESGPSDQIRCLCGGVIVQLLSHVQLFVSPWTEGRQPSLSFTISQSLLKFMFIDSVMLSNHLILCHPLLLLPSLLPNIRVFSNESVLLIVWPKYWSFHFTISPSNEYLGLISFRINWFDILAVQGTLKSLLQCHSSKASILQHSAFFIVQLSHPYMATEKTIALTRRTFVGKVMSLLSNTLGRYVIAFLSRSCFHWSCFLIYKLEKSGRWPWRHLSFLITWNPHESELGSIRILSSSFSPSSPEIAPGILAEVNVICSFTAYTNCLLLNIQTAFLTTSGGSPGGPVAQILHFQCQRFRSHPWSGN